ncbi:alpha/beta hydrolase [uncultured Sphingomonas sp.]|uniref:alpha/beta hydrolase n=1 Tax=uncultured Sphingomonas sp. TaxID=158754 RepID=UPI0035CC2F8F
MTLPFDRRSIPSTARISSWATADGWPLRRFDWPAAGPPRGSILFHAGRGDMVEKYLETLAHWHKQGWSVTSFDWRGQGGSGRLSRDPLVGHIEDFATYVEDFGAFWEHWAPAAPGPRVLIGHSMGGHLVLRALVERVAAPAAAVLVAPMLGLRTALGLTVSERLARIVAGMGDATRRAWRDGVRPVTPYTRENILTHDPDRYADELWWQDHAPELRIGPPSWRWVVQAFASTRLMRRDPRLPAMAVPVLMLVADADRLVLAKAAVAIAAQLPDVRLVRFGREAAHELLREADRVRDRALGEIDDFLAARAPPVARAA